MSRALSLHDPGAVVVGIGDIKYASRGSLFCLAVGSCVAVAMMNERTSQAAMAHIFLPAAPPSSAPGGEFSGKYADHALPEMARRLRLAAKGSLCAWIAGGAKMFPKGFQLPGTDIGLRNSEAVLDQLERLKIPVAFSDLGGTRARNVCLDILSRSMTTAFGETHK